MSTYVFKAMDVAGAPLRGQVDAESKQAVSDQLRARGLVILEIAEKHRSREINITLFERITLSDLAVFSRQLATMVSSGMTILRALFVLEEQTEVKKLKAVIVLVRKDVEAGLSFSVALSRHPKVFSPLFIAMVRAGEIGGVLEDSLVRIADQLEKEDNLRRQVRSAMVYPSVVLSVALIVMIVLVVYIVPVFAGVLKQFATTSSGQQLPAMTQVTVDVSHAITGYWYAFIGGAFAIIFSFTRWKRSRNRPAPVGRATPEDPLQDRRHRPEDLDRPLGPHVLRPDRGRRAAARGARHHRPQRRQRGRRARDERRDRLRQARRHDLRAAASESTVFPMMVSHMVAVGESTGELDWMLAKIADFYEERVAASVKALTSIIEPVMIVFIGGMVGFIVIAMYLPLFKVYNEVQ